MKKSSSNQWSFLTDDFKIHFKDSNVVESTFSNKVIAMWYISTIEQKWTMLVESIVFGAELSYMNEIASTIGCNDSNAPKYAKKQNINWSYDLEEGFQHVIIMFKKVKKSKDTYYAFSHSFLEGFSSISKDEIYHTNNLFIDGKEFLENLLK